jgi:glycogenin glucosyltransferase
MWYQVPEEKPKPAAPPKPIFPWEREVDRPKATRVFVEDILPEPTPATAPVEHSLPSPTHPFSTVHYEVNGNTSTAGVAVPSLGSPQRATSPRRAEEQWQTFQQSNVNAWDTVPGIDTYVRAIIDNQTRWGKTQVIHHADGPDEVLSPTIGRKNRRESLILTDFPTAVERPSLPVTPAPMARPTFWGEERDEQGELPQAEGVPDQAQWVCSRCGFSSVSESDFRRPSREQSSPPITTVTTTSPPTRTAGIAEKSPQTPIEHSQEIQVPIPTPDPPKFTPSPPKQKSRSGISPRGAPLASLTDPSLIDHQAHASSSSPSMSSTLTVDIPNIATSSS